MPVFHKQNLAMDDLENTGKETTFKWVVGKQVTTLKMESTGYDMVKKWTFCNVGDEKSTSMRVGDFFELTYQHILHDWRELVTMWEINAWPCPSIRVHVTSMKILIGFRLNLVHGMWTAELQASLISVRIGPINSCIWSSKITLYPFKKSLEQEFI